MELKNIIGQLFLLGFKGQTIDAHNPIVADIRDRNLGGVILFDKHLAKKRNQNNIASPAQLKKLTASLQSYSDTPLLIAVDQEGGMVRRLKAETGFPETASAKELGTYDDPVCTALHAACTATILRKTGVNYNLAPVADLDIFPDNPVIGKINRSISADPDPVIRHAAIWIEEHSKQNIISCLKHFPGHGSSKTDSHLGFTDISNTWQETELTPFQTLINQQNKNKVASVMMGHLFHNGLDTQYPTSLSQKVVENLLRKQLGYKGVVISDDLQMKAITDKYGLEESVCLALAAGVDMIIVGNNLEYDPGFLERIIPVVIQAVAENKISKNHIIAAWKRVSHMKKRLNQDN
jgi:beta-N-acetylhexosaminidase